MRFMIVVLILLGIALASGVYSMAEGRGGRLKSAVWLVCVISSFVLIAIAGNAYLRFITKGFPLDW